MINKSINRYSDFFNKPSKLRTSSTYESSLFQPIVNSSTHILKKQVKDHSNNYFYGQNYEKGLDQVIKHPDVQQFRPQQKIINIQELKHKQIYGSQSSYHIPNQLKIANPVQQNLINLTAKERVLKQNETRLQTEIESERNKQQASISTHVQQNPTKNAKMMKFQENSSTFDHHGVTQPGRSLKLYDDTNEENRKKDCQFSDIIVQTQFKQPIVQKQKTMPDIVVDHQNYIPLHKKVMLQKSDLDNHSGYQNLKLNAKESKQQHWNGLLPDHSIQEQSEQTKFANNINIKAKINVDDNELKRILKNQQIVKIIRKPINIHKQEEECIIQIRTTDKVKSLNLVKDQLSKKGGVILESESVVNNKLKCIVDQQYLIRQDVNKKETRHSKYENQKKQQIK